MRFTPGEEKEFVLPIALVRTMTIPIPAMALVGVKGDSLLPPAMRAVRGVPILEITELKILQYVRISGTEGTASHEMLAEAIEDEQFPKRGYDCREVGQLRS